MRIIFRRRAPRFPTIADAGQPALPPPPPRGYIPRGITGPQPAPSDGSAGISSHWISANKREWTPPAVVVIHAEQRQGAYDGGFRATLRCWHAQREVRRKTRGAAPGTDHAAGQSAGQLAATLTAWSARMRSVWVYAHDMGRTLQLTMLITAMRSHGWNISRYVIRDTEPWIQLKRGECVITLADAAGWYRVSLPEAARAAGMRYPGEPLPGDPDSAWEARAAAGARVVARTMMRLMDWWDREQAGNWAKTASQSSWNWARHLAGDKAMWADHTPGACEDDREAVYGGRRTAFRHGRWDDGPYLNVDFRRAYTQIAASHTLPTGRLYYFDRLATDDPVLDDPGRGVIAEVYLRTEDPRWPCRVPAGIIYPVGSFWTVLAGPEIADARRRGALVAIGSGWAHRMGGALQPWAQRCLKVSTDESGHFPWAVRAFAKHAGRAVIGKTAQRGWHATARYEWPGMEWHSETTHNMQTGRAGRITVIGGRATVEDSGGNGDDAYPAVLAYVESWCRIYLGRAMDAAGPAAVIQCDTDGMIVAGRDIDLDVINSAGLGPLEMRVKSHSPYVEISGPQAVIGPGLRKLAGIPRGAVRGQDGNFTGTETPALPGQMRAGSPGTLITRVKSYRFGALSCQGWALADGRVIAPRVYTCARSHLHVLPYTLTSEGQAGVLPAGVQAAGWAAAAAHLAATDAGCHPALADLPAPAGTLAACEAHRGVEGGGKRAGG